MSTRGRVLSRVDQSRAMNRICVSCKTERGAASRKSQCDFRNSMEWRRVLRGHQKLRCHWRILFRPRSAPQGETITVDLPFAVKVAGEGLGALGLERLREPAVVLVSCRLGGGAADLVVLTRSGQVGLGECKFGDHRDPWKQLSVYEKLLKRAAKRGTSDLWRRFASNYGRSGFDHLCDIVARHLKPEIGIADWCERIRRRCESGRIKKFVVRGAEIVAFDVQRSPGTRPKRVALGARL